MVCYHDNEPSECATEEEQAEFVGYVAYADAEGEAYEADRLQAEYDYQQYCSQNSWDCEEPNAAGMSSGGPSACDGSGFDFEGCGQKAVEATMAVGSHVVAIVGAEGALADAAAAGARLSKATRFSWAGAIATTVFAAGYYTGSFVNCVVAKMAGEPILPSGGLVDPDDTMPGEDSALTRGRPDAKTQEAKVM